MKLWQVFLELFKRIFHRKQVTRPEKHLQTIPLIKPDKINSGKKYIQVGLDFGTDSTKIVFTERGGTRPRTPIIFNHTLINYPKYCLPSLAAFRDSANFLLGIEAAQYLENQPWDSGIRRLKVLVAGRVDNKFKDEILEENYDKYLRAFSLEYKPEHIAAAFIAYAMRTARRTIEQNYPHFDLDLNFNVCVPIDHIQNNDVKTAFEKIFANAQRVEKHWINDNDYNALLKLVIEEYDQTIYDENDSDTRIFVIPESIAEVASYTESRALKEGIHAIIDFGAGTTDISIFDITNPHRENRCCYWYSTKNIPQGTYVIERIIRDNGEDIHRYFGQNPIPIDDTMHRIHEELQKLWEKTKCVWQDAYSHVRVQNQWTGDNVQIYLSGGGAKYPFIHSIFQTSWMFMNGWGPYLVEQLPNPDNYQFEIPFIRMAVAYGLSYDKPILMNYVLPKDAPNNTPNIFQPIIHEPADFTIAEGH